MNDSARFVLVLSFIVSPHYSVPAYSQAADHRMIGVNLAGAEFGRMPGVFNKDRSTGKPWLAAAAAVEKAAQRAREADGRLGRRWHDFGEKKESYHYSNEGSDFASEIVTSDDRRACQISFRHRGSPARIGVGIYFGSLTIADHDAFSLEVRADQPCRLEVKVYEVDGDRYSATYDVGPEWQELAIAFRDLRLNGQSISAAKPIQKIELQPSTSQAGNVLWLGACRLSPKL